MIGLLIITLSFVLYRRKVLLMLRALLSTRHLQQLLREGKLANERIFLYSILLYLFAFTAFLVIFCHYYPPSFLAIFSLPSWLLYVFTFGILVTLLFVAQLFLQYFTSIFNYVEHRYLYTTIKALFRFYNALFIMCITPIIWYARVPQLMFLYLPVFIILFSIFFIRLLKNINGISRFHFFIYFCTLEFLPYLIIAKLLIINL